MSMSSEPQQAPVKGNIIKKKYREQYKQHGMSCGDLIADELKAYVTVSAGGKQGVDPILLKKVAVDNNVWKDSYEGLNIGLRRMAIGNCLRKLYADGARLDIGGVPIYDIDLQLDEAA